MWITAQWEHMNKVKAPKAKILLNKRSFEASLVVVLIGMLGCHGEHRVWTNCWQAVRLRLSEEWSWTQVASELGKPDCLPHSRHTGKLPSLPGEKMKIHIWTNFHSYAAYLTFSSNTTPGFAPRMWWWGWWWRSRWAWWCQAFLGPKRWALWWCDWCRGFRQY